MKQNSSILFHVMHKSLRNSYLRYCETTVAILVCCFFCLMRAVADDVDKPDYVASFDPTKGFKPAQSDLTEVFLQIAASLEAYGSPEPYLRHMKAEHARVEAKYQQQLGDKPGGFCPPDFDDAYFDRFAANWKHMAPQLGLDSLARNTGRLMRLAINGPDGKGTILVEVFNQHQHEVYVAMVSKKMVNIPGFDVLKARIEKCTLTDAAPLPINLPPEQLAVVNPARDIRTMFLKLYSALDAGLSAADAEKVKTVLAGIVSDVGKMAQSELEIATLGESLDELRSPKPPYTAEQETALTRDEQKTFAAFLKKPRFTRADFKALDRFYSTVYDKLSTRGKLEMNHRVKAGMLPTE